MPPALHIVSWNVENLARHLDEEGKLAAIARSFGSPDLLCLQELKLRPADTLHLEHAKRALPGYDFACSLANDPKNASFRGGRVYGVGTWVKSEIDATILDRQPWDREGRLVSVLIDEMKLAVLNVYAVNGTDKAYWDHGLGRFEGDRHLWKRRFHQHLADLIRAFRDEDIDVLVVGDFNISQAHIDITPRLRTEEPHATNRAHFAETVVRGADLIDVFRELHPEERRYTWFHPRSRMLDAARVDFALLSRARMGDVIDATIPEARRGVFGSDHGPLHVTLRR